jgi:hypothetical protein
MRSDEVCKFYAPKKVGLNVRLIEADGTAEKPTMVLIEGSRQALMMLSNLLSAVASEDNDGFSISPFGAGSVHFSSLAKLGIYIHCLRD